MRDGLRTIELPLNHMDQPAVSGHSYEGLESLADEESVSPSLIYETEPEQDGTSELSVVFRGAHQSERPPPGSSAPDLRLVSSTRPVPPPPPTARLLAPEAADAYRPAASYSEGSYPQAAYAQAEYADAVYRDAEYPQAAYSEAEQSEAEYAEPDYQEEPTYPVDRVLSPKRYPPDHLASEDPITEAYFPPPRVPTEIPPPPAPAPLLVPPPVPVNYAASLSYPAAGTADYDDDEIETAVMPSRIPPSDSLRPVEVRPMSGRPTVRTSVPPPPRRSNWLAIGGAALLSGGAIAAAAYFLRTEQGDLVIDVADQQCGVVDAVEVFVDEELVCTASPCTLRVDVGSHIVSAKAEGYALTPAQAVVVDAEVPTLHRIQFGSTTKTGVEVRSQTKGYTLYLDGKLVGELPQRITGLSAGEHVLLISGGEGFYAEERKVDLEEDELTVIEDIVLKPRNGSLRIAMNEQLRGATVSLDGERIDLPFSRDLDASKRYHLVAKRAGFEDFETWVEFDGKTAEQDLNIQLIPKVAADESASESGSESERSEARASRGRSRGSSASSGSNEGSESNESGWKATGQARLSLISDPPAAVLLDGKPMGQTPRSVTVEPGTHSVLFIHPTKGRARATAKLNAGQAKTLRAKF